MPLKTDTFGITRYWVSAALSELPKHPDLFKKARLSDARKAFLAGANQLTAIKNWLSHAEVIDVQRGQAALTDLGQLMAAQDERAEKAWTWWLIHLHLCANTDAFPYTTFFWSFKPDGKNWWSFDAVVDDLCEQQDKASAMAKSSVKSYFEGVEQTFRSPHPLHALGLVERRQIPGEAGKDRIRRKLARPNDVVVTYATLLYQDAFFSGNTTVEAGALLEQNLGDALGMRHADVRESLVRIHQDSKLSGFLQYTQAANLDSIQFVISGASALKKIRAYAYQSGGVQWP